MKHLNENKGFVGWKPIITILLGTGKIVVDKCKSAKLFESNIKRIFEM